MRLIPISDEEYEVIKKYREIPSNMNHSLTMKILSHGNSIFFPDNATNGDLIKAMFPNALRSDYFENDTTIIYLQDENESEMVVPEDWWNAPYQKGGK